MVGALKVGEPRVAKMIANGRRRGMRAAWLPAVRWEVLLHVPLVDVRARMGIASLAPYAQLRTTTLRARGSLAQKSPS